MKISVEILKRMVHLQCQTQSKDGGKRNAKHQLSVAAGCSAVAVSEWFLLVPAILGHWGFVRKQSPDRSPPFLVMIPALRERNKDFTKSLILLESWQVQLINLKTHVVPPFTSQAAGSHKF